MIAAAEKSGKVGQAGLHEESTIRDSSWQSARSTPWTASTSSRINHLHPNNWLPPGAVQGQALRRRPRKCQDGGPPRPTWKPCAMPFGELCEAAEPVSGITSGLIHDLYSLRTMLGTALSGDQRRDLAERPRHHHGHGVSQRGALRAHPGGFAGSCGISARPWRSMAMTSGSSCALSHRFLAPGDVHPGGAGNGRGRPPPTARSRPFPGTAPSPPSCATSTSASPRGWNAARP